MIAAIAKVHHISPWRPETWLISICLMFPCSIRSRQTPRVKMPSARKSGLGSTQVVC